MDIPCKLMSLGRKFKLVYKISFLNPKLLNSKTSSICRDKLTWKGATIDNTHMYRVKNHILLIDLCKPLNNNIKWLTPQTLSTNWKTITTFLLTSLTQSLPIPTVCSRSADREKRGGMRQGGRQRGREERKRRREKLLRTKRAAIVLTRTRHN